MSRRGEQAAGRAPGNGAEQAAGQAPGNGAEHPDPYAEGVVDARLGRPARDILEATIVLEAWAGKPARAAMSGADRLVDPDPPLSPFRGQLESPDRRQQQTVVAEGIALILSILSVAAWARPLGRDLGAHMLGDAIRIALPLSVALQWGLRSRYLSRRHGLSLLGSEVVRIGLLVFVPIELLLVLTPGWGPVAAMLVPIWVGGTIATRRGWGLMYAAALIAGTVLLDRGVHGYVVLGALTAATASMCVAALLSRRARTDERPGRALRAALAALLGAAVGALLVADPSLGWGVHGVHPGIALVPSVIGSLWGGYRLWSVYEFIPRKLQGVPLDRAGRAALSDPGMSIFAGALVRLIGATVVLSALVLLAGTWTHGSDDVSVFVAFGAAALVSMLLGLLESLALPIAALISVAGALATELMWRHLAHGHVSGAALAIGAAVGALLALPPLLIRLARSGRVLATTLWIQ